MNNNKYIISVIFILLILLLNFGVFPNLIGPYKFVNMLCLFCVLIYIIKNYKKDIIFFNNKIDIIVLLLMFSSFIPLILNKCVSISNQYNYIMQSLSILSIYILAKNLCLKDKNKVISILIYGTIPIIIIAYDRLNLNFIWKYISNFNFLNINYDYGGLLANFNYPNSLGIYLSSILLLLSNQIIKNKNNVFNKTYFTILFTMIILTKSKAVLLLDLIFLFVYLYNLKKEDRKIILNLIFISISYLVLEVIILKFCNINLLKIFLQIILIIIYMELYFYKFEERNIINKKVIILFINLFILSFIYCLCLKNHSIPLNIKENVSFEYNTENLKDYNIKIDLNAIKNNNNVNNFKIKIYAIYKDGSSKEVINEQFEKYKGIKIYELSDTKKIYILRFTFENLDMYNNNDFYINNIFINDKEYIINYKYLPNNIGNALNNFSFKDKGMLYRLEYYKNAIKILKDSWLHGNGAYSWNYLYKEHQTFSYTTSESHSYLIDTFIDFGIISIILLISLYIVLIIYFIKEIKSEKKDISINLAVLLILIHSIIDFNMSFLLIKAYVFILIAVLSNTCSKPRNNKLKEKNIIYLVFVFILLFLNVCNLFGIYNFKKYNKEINIKRENYIKLSKIFYPTNKSIRFQYYLYNYKNKDLETKLLNLIKDENYYNQFQILNIISDINLENIKQESFDKKNIQNLYNIIKNNNIYDLYDINSVSNRVKFLIDIYDIIYDKYKKTKDRYYLIYANKIKDLILTEYDLVIKKNEYKNETELKDYNDIINNFIKDGV